MKLELALNLSDHSHSYGGRHTLTDAKQFQHNTERKGAKERERGRDVSLLVCVCFFQLPDCVRGSAARSSRWPRSPPPKGMCRRRRRTSPRVKCTTKCVRVPVSMCAYDMCQKGTGLESGLMLWSILYSEHVWAAVTGNTASVYIVPRDKWKKVCVCIHFFCLHARPSQCRTSTPTTVIYLSL